MRKVTLILLTVLFLVIGPGMVLYAYGWRLDLPDFQPIKVGGIFLRGISDARITLNGALVQSEDRFLTGGAFINNLLPGIYAVQVDKPGFYSWKKNLQVTPATVNETHELVLVPKIPAETTLVAKPIIRFWIHDEQLIYQDVRGRYFLTDTGVSTTTDLGGLFNGLKQQMLKFPGYVLIRGLAPADNSGQWIVSTANARYLLDTQKRVVELFKGAVPPSPAVPQDRRIPDRELILAASPYKDAYHFFIQYPGRVSFLELGPENPVNIYPIADNVLMHAYANGRLYLLRPTGLSYIEI